MKSHLIKTIEFWVEMDPTELTFWFETDSTEWILNWDEFAQRYLKWDSWVDCKYGITGNSTD
jgi:hypothetical protein